MSIESVPTMFDLTRGTSQNPFSFMLVKFRFTSLNLNRISILSTSP